METGEPVDESDEVLQLAFQSDGLDEPSIVLRLRCPVLTTFRYFD